MASPVRSPARTPPARAWLAVALVVLAPAAFGAIVYLLTAQPWHDPDERPVYPDLVRAKVLQVHDGVSSISAEIDRSAFPGAEAVSTLLVSTADLTWSAPDGTVHHEGVPACLEPGTHGQVVQLRLGSWHNTDTPGWIPVVTGVNCLT